MDRELDHLGLEQTDHRLGECIVVGATNAAYSRLYALLGACQPTCRAR